MSPNAIVLSGAVVHAALSETLATYPELHVVVHDWPNGSVAPQPPRAWFAPTVTVHGSGVHVPELVRPVAAGVVHSTVKFPLPANPVAQSTSQLLPYASGPVHVPRLWLPLSDTVHGSAARDGYRVVTGE
jgi:hypothetical protein